MRLRQLALLSAGLVVVRTGGAAFALLSQLLLARLLPADVVGHCLLAMSLAAVLGMLLTGGYPDIAATFLPRYEALNSERLRRGFLAAARGNLLACIAAAFVLAALVMVAAPLEADTRYAVAIAVLASPALGLLRMNNAIALSERRFQLSVVLDFFARPALLLLSILALYLLFGRLSLLSVLLCYLAVAFGVSGVHSIVLGRGSLAKLSRQGMTRMQNGAWRSRAAAYLLVVLATISYGDILILIAGILLKASDLAILGIAVKLAVFVDFHNAEDARVRNARPCQGDATGTMSESRALLARAAVVGMAPSLLAVLGGLIGGGFILSLFGPHYAQGSLILGCRRRPIDPGGRRHECSIAGNRRRSEEVSAICASTMLALFLMAALLTPTYGLAGVAIAVIVSDLLWVAQLALRARVRIGMSGDLFGLLVRARA